ncbi:caspase family protein [Dapis sp. BLCC M126]|uniref:caspase family protein n=1 Tax=Dapis sp. BLCC M126 TaxID=3400189 RepID=UPI003CFA4718
MAKNFAITIGINKYEHIARPLKYAASDAEKVRDFLLQEVGFDQVFYYSDYSPSINSFSTRPTQSNLRRLLTVTFEREFMGVGDNFWFFFSGHGARVKQIDYIIPSDAFTEDIENSAISVNYIIQRLQRCGADNVILILDACREQYDGSSKSIKGVGEQTEKQARQKGVISICSCSPDQLSWELDELQQGAFTYALLEGLGSKGRKATVEKLNEYLKYRVQELAQNKGQQTPRVMADPIEKSHLILMPKYATSKDIEVLKKDADNAQRIGERKKAKSLWRRVLNASKGEDKDAKEALDNIATDEKRKNSFLRQLYPKFLAPVVRLPLIKRATFVGAMFLSATIIYLLFPDDYKNLEKLLEKEKWYEAQQETLKVMLKVSNREDKGFMSSESIKSFPCKDLRNIRQLWVKYYGDKYPAYGYWGYSEKYAGSWLADMAVRLKSCKNTTSSEENSKKLTLKTPTSSPDADFQGK